MCYLIFENTLSSSPLSASTGPLPLFLHISALPFLSVKMLASLHTSVEHLPPSLPSLLYLPHLSNCPSFPALPSADHALITLQRDALPPSHSASPDVPHHTPLSIRLFFSLTPIRPLHLFPSASLQFFHPSHSTCSKCYPVIIWRTAAPVPPKQSTPYSRGIKM